MMTRGLILSPLGYYLSLCLSSTGTLAFVGTKSHFYTVISFNDFGKIFTMINVIDSLAPILSSTMFAALFKSTIDLEPGACYFVAAFFAYIAIIFCMITDYVYLGSVKKDQGNLSK